MTQPTLSSQISLQLTTSKSLTPSPTWLTSFLTTQRPSTPLPVLTQTALFRLLASDITTSLSQSLTTCFPPDIHNINIQERRIERPIAVQVLSIEDMSKSRWEQIEAIEAIERGEGTKGREIIRVPATAAEEEGGDIENIGGGGGTHKLALQDAKGTRIYGIELKRVEGAGLGMNMGCKIVLRNVVVARGMVLLEPGTTTMLGGKIEGLHKAWKEGRKAELKAAIEANERVA